MTLDIDEEGPYSWKKIAVLIAIVVVVAAVFVARRIRPAPATLPVLEEMEAIPEQPIGPWNGVAYMAGSRVIIPEQWLPDTARQWRDEACKSANWKPGEGHFNEIEYPQEIRQQLKVPSDLRVWIYSPEGVFPATLGKAVAKPDSFKGEGCVGSFIPLKTQSNAIWSMGVVTFHGGGKVYTSKVNHDIITTMNNRQFIPGDLSAPAAEWVRDMIQKAWAEASIKELEGPDGNPPAQIKFVVHEIPVQESGVTSLCSIVWNTAFWPPKFKAKWGIQTVGNATMLTINRPAGIEAEHLMLAFDLDRDGHIEVLSRTDRPTVGEGLRVRHFSEWNGVSFQPFSSNFTSSESR